MSTQYGIYDFNETYSTNSNINVDHIFVDWNDNLASDIISKAIHVSNSRSRQLLVTIEPFKKPGDDNLLKSIYSGFYNDLIDKLSFAFSGIEEFVYIRWGHEMENATGRYPWATNDPDLYIRAYRHFFQRISSEANKLRFVWSPVGEKHSEDYWVGKDFASYVGFSLYLYPEYEQNTYGRIRQLYEAFEERYFRLESLGKPIILAELGICGDTSFRLSQWKELKSRFHIYNKLELVAYFNAPDSPGVWQIVGLPSPDWSIGSSIFP